MRGNRLSEAVSLLCSLIETPSLSRQEDDTAAIWHDWLVRQGCENVSRFHNNVYAVAPGFNPGRPTLMLNSHHDTVKPSPSYTRDPFKAEIIDGRLYGLGSNDAGASGVALASTFLDLKDDPEVNVNLILAITAAEEVMGEFGMRAFLPHLAGKGLTPDMVIVGEPTGMQPAVAERGLLVLDGLTEGVAGHAARNEGVNALYRAVDDIQALRNFKDPAPSATLGPVKVTVTMIDSGTQHNVVPDKCKFVVDVRTTDAHTNPETVEMLQQVVKHSTLTPRSTHIQACVIGDGHPLVRGAVKLGLKPYVSPTTSDRAVMHGLQALKIGPGESSRSHTADEYVGISEIEGALRIYPLLIKSL